MSRQHTPEQQESARWVEYPLSVPGELAVALTRTLLPVLAGVGICFGLIIVIGLLGEEQLIPSRELTKALDLFSRFSMAPILLGGMAAWFLVALIQVGKQVATSRALVRAAEAHTPRTWVPHPNQLRLGTERPGSIYRSLFLVQGSVLGLFVVIGLPVLAFDYFEGGWLVIAVPMAWLGILGLGYGALREFVVPAQDERKNRILSHWSSRYRDEADEAAREAQGEIRDGAVPQQGGDRTSLQKVAGALVAVSGPMAGIGTLLLYGALLISHPNAQRWPGGRAGERADLSDELEMLVDQLVLWTAILVMAAVLTGLIGTVLQVVANNREKRTMWNAVKDPTAERPAEPILRRHSSIQPELLAQILAALAGGVLCLGVTGTVLATWDVESFASIYRDANEIFGPMVGVSSALVNAGLLLLAGAMVVNYVTSLGGRDLRNALQARWPSTPLKRENAKN